MSQKSKKTNISAPNKRRVKKILTIEEILILHKINTITLNEAKFLLERYYGIKYPMPHLNKQEEKIQKQMEKQFSDDTNREWRERFDKKFGTFTVGAGKGGTIATEYTLIIKYLESLIPEKIEKDSLEI